MPTIRIEYEVPEDDCWTCKHSVSVTCSQTLLCKPFDTYLEPETFLKYQRCQACIDAELLKGVK